MGREIVYCSQCGVRILEKDLATGRAFTVLDKVFCAECRDQAFTKATTQQPVSAKVSAGPSAPRTAAPPAPARAATGVGHSTSEIRKPPRAEGMAPRHDSGHAPGRAEGVAPRAIVRRRSQTPLYIGSAIGLVGIVVLIVIILTSDSDKNRKGPGGPGAVNGGGKEPEKKLTPEERAARRLNDLYKFAASSPAPADVVKRAVEAERDIVGTPHEEPYRAFRKKWERKVADAEAGKKIDALLAKAKEIAAGDPDFKRYAETLEILKEAEALAMEAGTEKVADVKNFRREIEEPYEAKADEWFEKYGPGIKQWMSENEFKGAKKMTEKFPPELRLSKVWRVNLTKMLADCDKGIAAQGAKAAGKEPEKDWKVHLRLGNNELNLKNYARAKENYLLSEKKLPAFDTLTDPEKRAVSWAVFYNVACIYAIEAKDLKGEEQAKSVDAAFDYLRKSAEAGVFDYPCGEREHKTAKDHWDNDKDLEKIRGDQRYADLVKKHAK